MASGEDVPGVFRESREGSGAVGISGTERHRLSTVLSAALCCGESLKKARVACVGQVQDSSVFSLA